MLRDLSTRESWHCGFMGSNDPARKLRSPSRGQMLSTSDRRLVMDQGFDRAVETVLDAFLTEGFTVEPVDGGDLHQRCATAPLRYALLVATLPELSCAPGPCLGGLPAILSCRISVFELTTTCTLVTVTNPMARYPMLASLVPRLTDRLAGALGLVAGRGAGLEAA